MPEYTRKGIVHMKFILENITPSEFAILELILKNPGCVPADFFFEDPNIDGRIKMLTEHELVSMNLDNQLFITELGRAAIVEYTAKIKQETEQKQQENEMLASLKEIAISAQKQATAAQQQADLALDEAKNSKGEALFAKITSIIALIISILGIVTDILVP